MTVLKAAHTSLKPSKILQNTAKFTTIWFICSIRRLTGWRWESILKRAPFHVALLWITEVPGNLSNVALPSRARATENVCLKQHSKMSFIFGNYHFVSVALNLHKGWYTVCKGGSTCRQIQSKEEIREWRDLFSIQWHAVHRCVCVCKRQAPQSPSSGLSVVGWIWYTVKCVPLLKRTLRIMQPL